jgi:hypothetical protein
MNLDIVHETVSLLRVAKRADERTISTSRSERSVISAVMNGQFIRHANKEITNKHANKHICNVLL